MALRLFEGFDEDFPAGDVLFLLRYMPDRHLQFCITYRLAPLRSDSRPSRLDGRTLPETPPLAYFAGWPSLFGGLAPGVAVVRDPPALPACPRCKSERGGF